jgi:hypothetical protein
VADHVVLLAPSSNRVYAGSAPQLVAAELAIMLGNDAEPVETTMIAGVPYLVMGADTLNEDTTAALGRLSGRYAVFRRDGNQLQPVEITPPDLFDDDLVSIPKYPGKTNEQFTRLLMNVTLAALVRAPRGPISILDPLCGRGTTLSTGLILGHDVAGVEGDLKAVEAYAAYLRTYLRRKRLKHSLDLSPVRREGKSIGRRLDADVTPAAGGHSLKLTVFTGDTRRSAELFGKRRFDAVVADAPYGVVHGSSTDVRALTGKRDRSAAGLLGEALPVWAGQLKSGGALGVSWNTLGLTRERLVELAVGAGLRPLDDGPHRELAHRVDSSIHRDVFVAVRI